MISFVVAEIKSGDYLPNPSFLPPQPSALVVFPPWVSVFHQDQIQGRAGPLEKWPRMMYSLLMTINSAKKESFKKKKSQRQTSYILFWQNEFLNG